MLSHLLFFKLGSVEGVVVDSSGTTLVRVSWEAVEGADYYTVSFSAAEGDDQEGLCRDEPHSTSVRVNVHTASVAVGGDVEADVMSILRAYTTYSVMVVALSKTRGTTAVSEVIKVITPQMSELDLAILISTHYFFILGSLAVPYNITGVAHNSTVIFVQWSGLSQCRLVNGVIVKYTIQYRALPTGLVESKEVGGNWSSGAETKLTRLTPSTYYSIEIAGFNEEGITGLYSDPVFISTLPGEYIIITPVPFSSHVGEYVIEGSSRDNQEYVYITIGASIVFIIITVGLTILCVFVRLVGSNIDTNE